MMAPRTNSQADSKLVSKGRARDERAVREMYEFAPYPDLGADLKDLSLYLDPILPDLEGREYVRFLDVGCGTGHALVGVAKQFPGWNCSGIDLSDASLKIASKLADKHSVKVALHRGSYLDPLPFDEKFDVISAIGTIHHCADPVGAMKNLRSALAPSGYLLLHLYGLRCDQQKFDIKNSLSILEPDLGNHERRFDLYNALMEHRRKNWRRRLALTTPADIYAIIRNTLMNFRRRRRRVSWSPSFTYKYSEVSAPWIDHFCHPCERAYQVHEVRALVEESGFRALHMLKQGREITRQIPEEWREDYERLDNWDKWRLSELLSVGGGSFSLVLQSV